MNVKYLQFKFEFYDYSKYLPITITPKLGKSHKNIPKFIHSYFPGVFRI